MMCPLRLEQDYLIAQTKYVNKSLFFFSGDLRLWVYIDTKSSGNCVCVVAKPTMTAFEMTQQVNFQKKCDFIFIFQKQCEFILFSIFI